MTPATAPRDLGARLAEQLAPTRKPTVADPVEWIDQVLGERLWSAQAGIARSVAEHRYTAVRSAHGIGKSHIASRLAAWFASSFPVGEAFVVVTAPTGAQIDSILFRYLGQVHRRGRLPGRITGGATPAWKVHDEPVVIGRKPPDLVDADVAAAAFQGIHARHVLVIIDEAAGVEPWLWEAVDTLTTSSGARVLAIGNPTDPHSKFAEACAPGSGWNSIRVSAFDTPVFTGEGVAPEVAELLVGREWVEATRRKYGEGSAYYTARVLAEFPEESEDGLIARSLIRAAQERDRSGEMISDPGALGVDVARGGDETVVYELRGGCARLVHTSHSGDLMRTTDTVAALLRGRPLRAAVDQTGLGAGVVDRLRQQGFEVWGFQGAEKAWRPDRFANRRAEAYWRLRELFEAGEIDLDPADPLLARQLGEVRWFVNSRGLVQIEDKAAQARRGGGSPDRADALSMAAAAPRHWAPAAPGVAVDDSITAGVLTEPM